MRASIRRQALGKWSGRRAKKAMTLTPRSHADEDLMIYLLTSASLQC